MKPQLKLMSVTVHYGKMEAIKNINIEIGQGTIVTLIGSNGAGKTTTLRAISGLIRLANGEIWFEDKRIDRMSSAEIVRLGIAHCPEGRRIYPQMSVMENLRLGAFWHKDKKIIERTLEMIYELFPILKIRARQRAGSFSGGEQQMLAIARAIMSTPRMLMLDEPSVGIAPTVVKEISKIILELNKSGIGIMLVEQNAHLALSLSSKGYVLETGRVVLEGESDELCKSAEVKAAYLGV